LAFYNESGDGLKVDRARAFELYTRACNGGFVLACTYAGNLVLPK
jgi:TPR repeat protein